MSFVVYENPMWPTAWYFFLVRTIDPAEFESSGVDYDNPLKAG